MDRLSQAGGPHPGAEKGDEMWLEVLMPNGLWIRSFFRFNAQAFSPSCHSLFDPSGRRLPDQHEGTHCCGARASLYDQLLSLLPALMLGYGKNSSWFRALNTPPPSLSGVPASCLWHGAHLRLQRSPIDSPAFGLCFVRTAFVAERDSFDFEAFERRTAVPDEVGWTRSEPSDSDRLRVNRRGREVLYFVHAPVAEPDLTVSELRAEIANALQISDSHRVALSAGPFAWGPDFVEDGLGVFSTYFNSDIVVEGRHMKTVHGAALIDVTETPHRGLPA